jgi:eukaryotic-like serine/threonine-protein kinase
VADGGGLNSESTLPLISGSCDRIPRGVRPRPARGEAVPEELTYTGPVPTAGVPIARPPRAGERYEAGALLGRGGGGEVYRGYDRVLRRQVAIKVLHGGEASALRAAQFDREVRLLARLQHPHLIPFHDAWQDGRRRYLVMPLVEGTTLAGRIASGPVPADEAQRIASALTGALAYIHAHGVVHRDVKPSNVLLGRDGRIFLADFGIARSVETDHTATRPGFMVGTAAYLAPEQVQGEHIGPACDVYSLGLVLLEALTGVRAYRGTTLELALARLWRQPEIPVSLGPRWVRLLDAMTARDPARRPDPASITSLLRRPENPPTPQTEQTAALALPAVPAAIRPPATQSPSRPPSRRWRMSAAALCASALTAGTLTVLKPSSDIAPPPAPPHAHAAQSPATAPATAPAAVTPQPVALIPVAVSAPSSPGPQAKHTAGGTSHHGRAEPPDRVGAGSPRGGGTDGGRGRGGGESGPGHHADSTRSGARSA